MALRRKQKPTDRSKLDATPPWEVRVRDETEPTTGPYDERDAPADDVLRADLGALRIPLGVGLDLQVEVDDSQQIVSATLAGPTGSMQLGLFAAPRNEGIWADVRGEIAESLKSQGGKPVEVPDGPFGAELTGTIASDQGRVRVRFIGIDGPRWFLRAMLAGAAAEPGGGTQFEGALRDVIVNRGVEPLPVREPVPLVLPKDIELPTDPADAENG